MRRSSAGAVLPGAPGAYLFDSIHRALWQSLHEI